MVKTWLLGVLTQKYLETAANGALQANYGLWIIVLYSESSKICGSVTFDCPSTLQFTRVPTPPCHTPLLLTNPFQAPAGSRVSNL